MTQLLFWLVLALVGCGADAECDEENTCRFGQVCIEGACVTKSCATSAQCPMEHTCDDGSCTEGCGEDDDCYPGDVCGETGACEPKDCRDTRVDCGFQEFCNEFTGECYEAGGYYCKICNDDNDCGGNGNHCYGGYCGVDCSSDADCPSGFQCYAFSNAEGVQYYNCWTWCAVYADDQRAKPAYPVDVVELPTCELLLEEEQ